MVGASAASLTSVGAAGREIALGVTRPSLAPPFEDQVAVFGIAMVVFLVAPLVLERYRLPGIVGIIISGAVIGPAGLNLVERGDVELLGTVGLVYLLFVAGLEIDTNRLFEYRDRSFVFGALSFLVPQVAGMAAGVVILGLSVPAAALFASIFASHTLLAYPVVNRLGIVTEESVTVAIGGTVLTDTLALLVLAIVLASNEGELTAGFWVELLLGLAIFFCAVWFLVPRLARWFFRIHGEGSYYEFLFVMVVLFASAFLAELAGIEAIVGAFVAGLALNRLIPPSGPLLNRIEFVGNALFIPFFLLSVGMLVDVRVLFEGTRTLVVAGTLLVLVVTTKYAAAWLTGRLYGYGSDEVAVMFGLSVGQAAAALAIVLIAFETGIPGFSEHVVNGVIVMILVVSLLGPWVASRGGTAVASAREREPYDPTAAPRRILLPVSLDSAHRESLLDLALAVREDRSTEPIHALSVIDPGRGPAAEADAAEAEAVLAQLRTYAAAAAVPVVGHTRANHNVASGIVNSALENRISTIVIGWDGAQSREQYVFGHVIDQVLQGTGQLTLVGRIRRPLQTARRLLVICPPGIEHNVGFPEAIHAVKRLAVETGAPIEGVVVDGDPARIEQLFDLVEPETHKSFATVGNWNALRETLEAEATADDVVVCVSARRDDPGWHPTLQTLPGRIASLTGGTFAVVYPATADRADDRRFLRFT